MFARLRYARAELASWLDRTVRLAVRDEFILQRTQEQARPRDPTAAQLPAGVFVVPPQKPPPAPTGYVQPMTGDEDLEEYTAQLLQTTMGQTFLVQPGGGEVDAQLEFYQPMPSGAILFAWGPVHLASVAVGGRQVVNGGSMFASLPAIMPGEILRARLAVWRRDER